MEQPQVTWGSRYSIRHLVRNPAFAGLFAYIFLKTLFSPPPPPVPILDYDSISLYAVDKKTVDEYFSKTFLNADDNQSIKMYETWPDTTTCVHFLLTAPLHSEQRAAGIRMENAPHFEAGVYRAEALLIYFNEWKYP